MLRAINESLKFLFISIFALSVFGCAISDANIKGIHSFDKPASGNGLVYFSTSFKSDSWLGIGPSVILKFTKKGPNNLGVKKLEIMSVSDKKLHVLELPEGSYTFRGFLIEQEKWEIWCDSCFDLPFEVKDGAVSYAGHIALALSKSRTKVKIKHIDKAVSDRQWLKDEMHDFDLSLIQKNYIHEQSRVIDIRR